LDAIRKVDEQIGSILSALKSRPDFAREDWQIVLTSDHGGAPDGRHDGGTPEKRTVPFLVTSRIATQGLMGGRPEIVDVAPTVLAHMGSTAPAVYDGRAQGCLHVVASGSQSGKAGRNRGERQPAGTTGKSSKGFENSPNRTDVYDSPPAGQRASIRFRPTEPPYIIPC
jgi:arylsulfatase A-like enzyme